MKKEELAEQVNGREYGQEMTEQEKKEADEAGLIVVFGASDDIIRFSGAIDDEIGCYGGISVYLTPDGMLENKCEDHTCPYFEIETNKAKEIEAIWDTDDGYSWTYRTEIPHSTFEIMEDGEKYCKGIVFEFSALSEKL